VLKQSSLLIFPGGGETLYKALQYAVPMIAVPGLLEQEHMAYRLEEHGVAERIDSGEFDSDHLDRAVENLMSDKTTREALDALRNRLREYKGLETSADRIEDFLR